MDTRSQSGKPKTISARRNSKRRPRYGAVTTGRATMAETTSDELLGLFDSAPLNARYWTSFAIASGVLVLDFFDFFLIAFVMSVIGPEWKLTYGQGAIILYGAGVGAIVGALTSGSLGDMFGRKMQTVIGTLICGVCAGSIGLLPDGAWIGLAV